MNLWKRKRQTFGMLRLLLHVMAKTPYRGPLAGGPGPCRPDHRPVSGGRTAAHRYGDPARRPAMGSRTAGRLAPLLLLAATSAGKALLAFLRSFSDAAMNRRTSLYVLGRIQDRALHVPLERLEDPGYYDCLGRAQAAAGENLTGMLRQAAETVRLLFLFGGMLLIVSAGHSLISILLAAVTLFVLIGRSRIEIAVKRLNREWTTDGRMADYLKHSLAEPEVLKELKLFGAAGYIKRLWSGRMTAFLTRRNDFRRQENRMSARFAFAYTVPPLPA
ncbi:hypothetical protein LJK88_01835 [Paenibacillus sp. P26]|nr:hypothetical protein LJK88_01835 [Paenibacillus sp. P26]